MSTVDEKIEPTKRVGRPAYVPGDTDKSRVVAWAAAGVPQRTMCKMLGISVETLEKYFRDELDHGGDEANAQVANVLFTKALSGDLTACIFWAKTRMRWSEKAAVGDRDNPLVVEGMPDPNVALRAALDLVEKAARGTQSPDDKVPGDYV